MLTAASHLIKVIYGFPTDKKETEVETAHEKEADDEDGASNDCKDEKNGLSDTSKITEDRFDVPSSPPIT